MKFRLGFLLCLLLPELTLNPFRGDEPGSWLHPLGFDSLGREGMLRLLHASGRSFGFASAVTLLSLGMALLLALGEERLRGARSSLRAMPPLLLLLTLAAFTEGLGWISLALVLSSLMALQMEEPLRARLDPMRHSPAWSMAQIQGATWVHRVRTWAPWTLAKASALAPSIWIAAVWDEAALRLLGLGPPPTQDSLGLLLGEELPRLATDPTALGWASLAMIMLLAASYGREEPCR